MKLEPIGTQIIGRMVVVRPRSTIILPAQVKVSKFMLVDAVGEGVKRVKAGDLVMPKTLGNIVMDNGSIYVPWIEEANVGFFVREVSLDELLVQTDSGAEFVPFGSQNAAQVFGAQPPNSESEAA